MGGISDLTRFWPYQGGVGMCISWIWDDRRSWSTWSNGLISDISSFGQVPPRQKRAIYLPELKEQIDFLRGSLKPVRSTKLTNFGDSVYQQIPGWLHMNLLFKCVK